MCRLWVNAATLHNATHVDYLTAEAADAGLPHHAEQLRLSRVLVAQEADARLIVSTHEARVRRGQRPAALERRRVKLAGGLAWRLGVEPSNP